MSDADLLAIDLNAYLQLEQKINRNFEKRMKIGETSKRLFEKEQQLCRPWHALREKITQLFEYVAIIDGQLIINVDAIQANRDLESLIVIPLDEVPQPGVKTAKKTVTVTRNADGAMNLSSKVA